MRFLTLLLFIISSSAFGFTPLPKWNTCEGNRCVDIISGDDLYLKHNFKKNKAIYKTTFSSESIYKCIQQNDCWLYLGSVGDAVSVKLNDVSIGKFEEYIHFESLKFHIPSSLISSNNELVIEVIDLNQTRFGLRSPDIGIGLHPEVNRKSRIDWILRTGSTLLSAFTLFVLFLGLIATYAVYKNTKIVPLIGLSFISVLYLINFSEIPRQYFDPIYISGPVHFVIRLFLDLTLVLVALSLYRPHQKISFLRRLPAFYVIPVFIMIAAAFFGVHQYAFYKTTMLIVAPLVIGGGFALALLSYYYIEQKERRLVLPIFLGLLLFQIYDLVVFWELVQGSFTVKWYLPFLVISFSWIYVRRRIFEVRTLKIDALVGDEVRKLAHDLAAPIQSLASLTKTYEHDLVYKNVKDLEKITNQVLGKYNHTVYHCEKNVQNNLHSILSDIEKKFKDLVDITFNLSAEFDWYCVDEVLFLRTFTNFITNSIKAKATEVKINGYYQNTFLNIEILDNGNGIPEKLQPYIFDKGFTSDKTIGNGLGLSFIKEKFYQLGFNISLQRSTPKNTVFQIRIPLREIVLIDDNPLVRDTWKTLAERMGLIIHSYSSFGEFQINKVLNTETPIFVDYELEDENGIELVSKLRRMGYKHLAMVTGILKTLDSTIPQLDKNFPIGMK